MEQAKEALAQVIVQKQRLLANITNRRAHVFSLPTEILSKIFFEGYRSSRHEQEHDIESKDVQVATSVKYLLAISHTSRIWRSVSISMSSLWAHIDLNWPTVQTRLWLARSGTIRGLDVYAQQIDYPNDAMKAPSDPGSIFEQFPRWRSLCLLCSHSVVRRVFQRINDFNYTCDQLESLEIKYWGENYHVTPNHQNLDGTLWSRHARNKGVDHKALFPHLRSVTIWPGDFSLVGMLTAVINLDIYVPTYRSWQDWRSVLVQAPVLETLRITSQTQVPVELSLPLRLERLRALDIGTATHDSFIQCWLHNISAPSLRALSFSLSWRPVDVENEISAWLCDFVSTLNSYSMVSC